MATKRSPSVRMSLSDAAIPALLQAQKQQVTTRFIIFLLIVLFILAILVTVIYFSVYAKEQSIDINPFQ